MATRADDYRAKALDCARRAAAAPDQKMRESYRDLEQQWLQLAVGVEAQLGVGSLVASATTAPAPAPIVVPSSNTPEVDPAIVVPAPPPDEPDRG